MIIVMNNGNNAQYPKISFFNEGMDIIIKNMLDNKQKPIAGKDQRGKLLTHPMPSIVNMARTDATNMKFSINDGIPNPEFEKAHAIPNIPKGMAAKNDVREENDVSILINFKVNNSISFILL